MTTRTSAAQMQVLLLLQWLRRNRDLSRATVRELMGLAQQILYFLRDEEFRQQANLCGGAFNTNHDAWDFPDRFKRALRGLHERRYITIEEDPDWPRPNKQWPSMRDTIVFDGVEELDIHEICPKLTACSPHSTTGLRALVLDEGPDSTANKDGQE